MRCYILGSSFFLLCGLAGQSQVGPLGSYPFSGNANDVSGNGNNGVVNGAVLTSDRYGNSNAAYYFDGVNDYIDLGSNFPLASHSFACWARRDSATGNTLVSKINNGPFDTQNSEYSINVFTIGTGTTWTSVNSTASPVNYAQWNCYVATYNALTNTAKLYVNGMVDSAVVGNYSDVPNTPIYIGARPFWSGNGGPAFFFRGAIDEVLIYNRVISQAEADSLCIALFTTAESLTVSAVNVFPNPCNGVLNVSLGTLSSAKYELYDVTGRVMMAGVLSSSFTQLNISSLRVGLYLLRVIAEGGALNRRVVVKGY